MAKYYYNGVLLPDIPAEVLAEYPYAFLCLNGSEPTYRLVLSKNKYFFQSSDNTLRPGTNTVQNYWLSTEQLDAGDDWQFRNNSVYYWNAEQAFWANYSLPRGSATSTDVYLRGSHPTLTPIHLTNQWNASIANNIAELTMELSGCTPGNMLILAYAVRGADNVVTLSDGWTVLGGGNVISTPESSYQYVLFAYKMAESAAETVTISQTEGKRIYAVCSEYFGVAGVKMRRDLAAIGTSGYTVAGEKTKAKDTMLYAVTSAYYGSGRNQTVTPTDIDKIEGDSSAERLACWFDGGLGATSNIFQSYNSTEARDAVLECVQLILYDTKYLIRSNSTLYTVADGALSALTETDVTAILFQTYGVNDVPDGSLLATLTDPEVLYWQESTDDLPTLSLTVKGTPPVPQVVVTDAQDMSDGTILGIESVSIEASADVLWALSFDDGASWKAYDGTQWVTLEQENSGMTAETFQNIPLEAWAEIVTSDAYRVRFVLMDTTSYVTSLVIHYLN